ncbi:hypothetical protein V5O48_016711 [Marasmius crinis-equi]|uniref:Uncharacterized protein n=1 Tax=Marasmius crinis-equi TaxID=585013 RepID=A0ABR3ER42_9AGAR
MISQTGRDSRATNNYNNSNIYIGSPIQGTAPCTQTSDQKQAEPPARGNDVPDPSAWGDCGRFVFWIFDLIYRQLQAGDQGAASRNVGDGRYRERVDPHTIEDTVVDNSIVEDTV